MRRRLFDHFFTELSVALGRVAPRYPLWMALAEAGADPDFLDRPALRRFLDGSLQTFLADHGEHLSPSALRRLRRRVLAIDPRHPTPYEHMTRLMGGFER